MADDTDTDELTLQQDERTPEDHLKNMKLAILANEAMRREELSLQNQAGTPAYEFGRGIGVLQPQAPVPPPTATGTMPPPAPVESPPRNRIYIGPMQGAPGASPQEFFGNIPSNTNINLAPPPSVGNEGYDRGVASGLIEKSSRRLTPTDIAWTPAYEQWAAQQDLQAAVAKGVPIEKAAVQYPAAFAGAGGIKPNMFTMTPSQQAAIQARQASLEERKREFDLKQKDSAAAGPPTITKLDDRYSVVRAPGSKAWRLIDSKTGETKAFTPAQAAGLLTKITKEEQDNGSSALSGLKEDLTKIVRQGLPSTPVEKPTTATGVKVTTKAQYDALASGTIYMGKDGKKYRKP